MTDKEESTDEEESLDLSGTPPLEGDEEVKKEKRSKILTPNKLLTRLPILLAQIKAGNNSYNLKNEIRQMYQTIRQTVSFVSAQLNLSKKAMNL